MEGSFSEPTIEGVSHLTLIVRDLERTGHLLTVALGATEVYTSGEASFSLSKERFFVLGRTWIALIEGEPQPQRTYDFYDHDNHLFELHTGTLEERLRTYRENPRP